MIIIRLIVLFIFTTCCALVYADAVCRDGTHSYSTGRGTCSHHGGVQRWISPTKVNNVPPSIPSVLERKGSVTHKKIPLNIDHWKAIYDKAISNIRHDNKKNGPIRDIGQNSFGASNRRADQRIV